MKIFNSFLFVFVFALAFSSCVAPKSADYSAPEYFYTKDEKGAKYVPPFKDYGVKNKTEKK